MNGCAQTIQEVFKQLNSSEHGLTETEVQERLHKFGLNKLETQKKVSAVTIFLKQFQNFLVIILILAGFVSLGISFLPNQEESFIDAILIFLIIFANAIFGFMQDYKAEKSIEALKKLSMPRTWVIRNGLEKQISIEYLVPGDIVLLKEGDKIPADLRLLESVNLTLDESSLTGESLPVEKEIKELEENTVLAERKNMAYMSTACVRGKGKGIVIETGMKTELGKIAAELLKIHEKQTLFDLEIEHLAQKIGFGVLLVILIVALTEIFLHQSDFLTVFLISVSLAVAAIPEGLPAVVTLSLALGVNKMSKQNALMRRLSTVESLGSINVICTDKTGTLTENSMTVVQIFANQQVIQVTGSGLSVEGKFSQNVSEMSLLLKAGVLCNDAHRIREDGTYSFAGDPTEIAVLIPAYKAQLDIVQVRTEFKRIGEIAFSSNRKCMTTIHQNEKQIIVFSKGAPEIVLNKCNYFWMNGQKMELTSEKRTKFLEQNNLLAQQALRVLGFAFKENPESLTEKGVESDLIFLGLMGMMDPPRAGVKQAIADCRTAGIRVIMITGDNALTGKAVGHELGFSGSVIQGSDLDGLSQEEVCKLVEDASIFARTSPEHKVKILLALKQNGHSVAMTGDGVNDAPALKNSDVGISMGIRGTDVAKETSDMILLDDNFVTIRNAIEQGRGIFENIRKFVAYLLGANSAEVMVVFFGSLLGLGLPLTAIQLLWINLLTDGVPALALGLDPVPRDVMKQKPRKKEEKIINQRMVYFILTLGISATVILLYLFSLYNPAENLVKAQTVVFTGFVVFELIKVFLVRNFYSTKQFSNKWLFLAVGFSLILQVLVLFSPLKEFFKLPTLTVADLSIIGLAGLVFAVLVLGFIKLEKRILK
ncbi:MAG: calcium-translocating P-type ATPase, PMCA-type [Candidatus Diapherotrites archaeon]|nr:calcium-translocating P-type ATPase, PMCA-type [Candidatus Diapherotrites archaeon]